MTIQEIIQNIPSELFNAEGNTPLTRILVRDGVVSVLPNPYLSRDGDKVYDYSKQYGSIDINEVAIEGYPKEYSTAEDWLAAQGYSSVRLITLLDLEAKLAGANKTSAKMTVVRSWIDGLLAAFVLDPAPKNNWPPAPFTFEQTTQEAFTELTSNE
jgi:hypothetical protein